MDIEHVVHPVHPVYDENSKVLILGTMASPASRKMGFFYGHPQNRFWKVLAQLFDDDPGETAESRRAFALCHNIALADVISECDIAGASDSSIRNPVAMDLTPIFATADIQVVFTTGAKASQLYKKLQLPKWTDVPHIALPSTSGANARMRLPDLVSAYMPIVESVSDDFDLMDSVGAAGSDSGPKPYYVYIARCSDGSLYTGITDDIEKRMDAHNSGKGAKYTRSRRPVECIYTEKHPDRSSALKREKRIKAMTRAQKQQLIG